jgi:hypothetical protein
MDDERLFSIYQSRGIPTEWQELTPDAMAPAFRLFFRALPSPSMNYPGAADAEELLHDPLTALRKAGIVPEDDEGRMPSISTFVVNHEHTLNRMVMYASVAVSTNPHTIGITIVKEPVPPEEEEAPQDPADFGE